MDDTAHGPGDTQKKVGDPEIEGWVKGDELPPAKSPELQLEKNDSTFRVGQGEQHRLYLSISLRNPAPESA